MTAEPPAPATPLMHETRTSSFQRQSHHECTLSHRSPRGRRSCELNQHASVPAWTWLALHRDARHCVARDTGVDRHAWMAGGQGFQPLVTPQTRCCPSPSPMRLSIAARRLWSQAVADAETAPPKGAPQRSSIHVRKSQSGLGARCATALMASPRSVSLASCSYAAASSR
jgi:hypothetical protein